MLKKIEVQEDIVTDAAVTEPALANNKKESGRKPLPKYLPRETHIIDVAEADKVCPYCKGDLHRIGEEKSEQLEYIPASLNVIETLRPKYACRQCEKIMSQRPLLSHPYPQAPSRKVWPHPACSGILLTTNTNSRCRSIARKWCSSN